MKKFLCKTMYCLLALSFVLHMFVPFTVRAIGFGSKQITFAWNCNESVCATTMDVDTYYETSEGRTYADNIVVSSTVTDDAHTFVAADATSYGKVNEPSQFYIFEGNIVSTLKAFGSWEDLDVALHEDPTAPHAIDPCGGKDGVNSVSHNGDRDFRLTVYDAGYTPIAFNVDPSTYTYYLGEWDPVFTNPVYDISGTTEEKPLEYNTYLLEDTLKFSMAGITSVEALNVPTKGVKIEVIDGEAHVTFKSNYYSNVTFKITLNNGKTYYLKVNRIYTQLETNRRMNPDGHYSKLEAYASFMYPSDKSYTDYDVFATITTTNGTTTKKLTAKEVDVLDKSDGVVTDIEFPAGENLKKAYYPLGIDENVKDVKITVTKKDATTGSVYGGTFGGYGEGVSLNDLDIFVRTLTHPMV